MSAGKEHKQALKKIALDDASTFRTQVSTTALKPATPKATRKTRFASSIGFGPLWNPVATLWEAELWPANFVESQHKCTGNIP